MSKKNIFLIANSYWERCLLYNIEDILNCQIDQIFLPYENHCCQENFHHQKIKLVCHHDFISYLKKSDIVVIINTHHEQNCKLTQFKKLSSDLDKTVIFVDFTEESPVKCDMIRKTKADTFVVLQINISKYSQHYCTEIFLNKFFRDKNIDFFQRFSLNTNAVLNKTKVNSASERAENPVDVIIEYMNVKTPKDVFFNQTVITNIQNLHPDYIILYTDLSFDMSYESINDFFVIKYGIPINVIIKSPHIELNNSLIYVNNLLQILLLLSLLHQ